MYKKYEDACREANLEEAKIRKIRNIFADDRKKLREKDKIIEEMHYTRVSIDSEMTDDERSMTFNIPDENCDVAEEAVWNVSMEKLLRCLELISAEEKELVITFFDKKISFSKYAEAKGVERTEMRRRANDVVIKIREMMNKKSI